MSDDAMRLGALNEAYLRGDHELARRLAEKLARSSDPGVSARAKEVLAQTEPDSFIYLAALVGLGLVAFLVYNYIL